MKTNNNIETLFANFLSNKASEDDVRELKELLDENEQNVDLFLEYKQKYIQSYQPIDENSINVDNAYLNFKSRIFKPNKIITLYQYWQRVAAILILPLILYVIINQLKTEEQINNTIFQTVITDVGTRSFFNLPDGSKVWLNSGSSLKYPLNFNNGLREVELIGEGFFEVQSDKDSPFIVYSNGISTTATGTKFNINAYNQDSIVEVTLVEGCVNIGCRNISNIQLSPGERIVMNTNNLKSNIYNDNTYRWYAWTEGKIIFKNDSLENVLKLLSRKYNIDFKVNDDILNSKKLIATFEDESLEEILRLLSISLNIKYDRVYESESSRQQISIYQ